MASGLIRAWDLPTRLFHWTLVLCIASAYVSFAFAARLGDATLRWHRWNGMFILVLLVWRLMWGFAGGSTSRFAAFITWPWSAAGYLLAMLRGEKRHYLGHNPAGAWMILVLLAAVTAQAGLGLYTLEHNEIAAGPLYRTIIDAEVLTKQIQKWHRAGFYWLLALIGVHAAANIAYQFLAKDKLVTAMVTGQKPAGPFLDQQEAKGGSAALAAALLVAAAVIVYAVIIALGGRIF